MKPTMDSMATFPPDALDRLDEEVDNEEITMSSSQIPDSPRRSLLSKDDAPSLPNRRSTMQLVPFHYRPAILLFGDSLTQYGYGMDGQLGWAALLTSAYQRRADVINRGFSGYNTVHAQEIVQRRMGKMDQQLLFATIWFGANDAAIPGSSQHVPIGEYRMNLELILNRLRVSLSRNRNFAVLLLTPPPVDEKALCKAFDIDSPDRTNELARAYGDMVKEVAAEDDNCAVVDTWDILGGENDERGQYLSDGLHLNGKGNQKVYEAMMQTIKEHFPQLAPMEGDGKSETQGLPMEEALWRGLCGETVQNK